MSSDAHQWQLLVVDMVSLTQSENVLFMRSDLTITIRYFRVPNLVSLKIRPLCHTLPNAFIKSRKAAAVFSSWSVVFAS